MLRNSAALSAAGEIGAVNWQPNRLPLAHTTRACAEPACGKSISITSSSASAFVLSSSNPVAETLCTSTSVAWPDASAPLVSRNSLRRGSRCAPPGFATSSKCAAITIAISPDRESGLEREG